MRKIVFWIGIISLSGSVYSGVLMYSKFTTGTCSFGTVCPYLFGLPVCVYGFVGFSIVFLLSIAIFAKQVMAKNLIQAIYWISLTGAMFALYFLIQELFVLNPPSGGKFGYPSCLYGLVAFGLVYVFSRKLINENLEEVKKN